ncbi:N/A [soil metagenome]
MSRHHVSHSDGPAREGGARPGARRTASGWALRALLRRLVTPAVEGLGLVPAAPPVPVREIFRRFWPYARPFRGWLLLGLVVIALVPAIEAAEIWLFKILVDDVLVPRDLGPLGWVVAAYLGLSLGGAVMDYADDYLATWVGERFLLSVRTSFFRHLQSLSHAFLDRRRLGDVLARLTGDVTAVESFVLSGVAEAVSSVLRILFFAGALFWLDWQLALVSLFVAPLFLVAVRVFAQPLKDASREKRRRSGSLSSVAEESLSNAALVQAYNRQDSEVERFHRENRNTAEAELAATRVGALFTPLVDLVELAGGMLVILFGVYALSAGRLTLGGLLVFLTYLSQLYRPIRDLGELGTSIYSASASAERIIEFLDQSPLVTERPDARRLDTVRGAVEFDDVSLRYPGAGHDALRDVSLRVEPGQVLALVGASGAGKSTVARLLLRFFDPTRGAVRLDGHDLRALRLDSLRDQVGVLLQETLVFDGSVRDNIAFGRPDASTAEIEAAARAADAHDFVSALPAGACCARGGCCAGWPTRTSCAPMRRSRGRRPSSCWRH